MKKSVILSAMAVAAFLTNGARGHDTWLLPDRFEVASRTPVTLDLTSGMAFSKLDAGPKRDRVQTAPCRLAGQTFEISDISAAPNVRKSTKADADWESDFATLTLEVK